MLRLSLQSQPLSWGPAFTMQPMACGYGYVQASGVSDGSGRLDARRWEEVISDLTSKLRVTCYIAYLADVAGRHHQHFRESSLGILSLNGS